MTFVSFIRIMKRREFIQRAGLVTAGSVFLPHWMTSCGIWEESTEVSFKGKVVIVGAGAAGLYAGYLLGQKDIQYEILEASSFIGGRLRKNETLADFPIDLGAEWLHGNRSLAADLVKKHGVDVYADESEGKIWYKGQLQDDIPDHLEQALNAYEKSEENISFWEFFQKYGATDIDHSIVAYLAGEYGASPEKISVKWTNHDEENWSAGNRDSKFRKTYYDLMNDFIVPHVKDKIKLNCVIKGVSYGGDKVELTDLKGNIYQADKVILALPHPVLRDGDIQFTPNLPAGKTEAFRQIGSEPGMKIFMKFSERFYDQGVVGGKYCPLYGDEAYGLETKSNVLLGFVMGDHARFLSDAGEEETIRLLLAELDEMYDGKASASFQRHLIQDWFKEPFIRGAYSYSTINGSTGTRSVLSESINDKLYFAGEYSNDAGHHQTVHGALESGLREVEKILQEA